MITLGFGRRVAGAAWFVLALGAGVVAACGPAAAQVSLADIGRTTKQQGPQLFRSVEFNSPSLKALPQWNRVQAKMQLDRARLAANPSWQAAIAQARGLPKRAQINAINSYFNKWPYKLDMEIYGASEYWATPTEFMAKSGDCEDYAIAKFYALRELGFRNDELRVVALYDRIRGIGHAILAVYTGADILVLDNLSGYTLSHKEFSHYDPQYSVNETTRWAHVVPSGGGPAKPAR